MRKISCLFFFLSFCVATVGLSQKTLVYTHQEADYKLALKKLEEKKYAVAQRGFKKVVQGIEAKHSEIKMSAQYYQALCALELFNDDAELLFTKFIEGNPQSPKIRLARFQLGKFYYRKNRWRNSLKWFKDVDVNELEEHEVPEFYFKSAYSSYKIKDFSSAQKYFNEAKQLESIYKSPSVFYYAYLSYKFNFNETALKGFDSLKEDESFGAIVPYYIIQIYYLQKKYDKIVEVGPSLVETAIPKKMPDIARIVAEGYYRKNDYVQAVKYLEIFMEKGRYADSTANYQMAYSYYKTKQWDKAIPYFQETSGINSEIGQLSLYYLGEIYLKNGNKQAARSAFRFASKTYFNKEIKENALFNYAKLSYELDIDPYHESIIALEKYIDEFPGSSRELEARKYLLNVYLNTKNYQRAIVALDKIETKDLDIQYAYQKIAYYHAIQLFNNAKIGFGKKDYSNFKNSIFYFQKSLEFPIDKKIKALSYYWKAEAYYRSGDLEKALLNFKAFKSTPSSILLNEYADVDYQIGYCHFELNSYGPAINFFRKFLSKQENRNSKKVSDATIRIGDSYLINKNTPDDLILSVKYFDKALQLPFGNKDYVHFQKAQAYMLMHKDRKQANELEALLLNYPNSKYQDEANYILGETYLVGLGDFEKAIVYFQKVIDRQSSDVSFTQKAYNGLGVAYNNSGSVEKALVNYENSIALNPRSEEAAGAIEEHKLICQEKLGDAQKHIDFRSNIGLPDMTQSSKDSSKFYAAQKFFSEKDYTTTIQKVQNYLVSFPKALFYTKANYYLAASYYALNKKEEALLTFELVLKEPIGEFTERSAYYAASINYENKEFQKAISRYLFFVKNTKYDSYLLDSKVGIMRSYRELLNHEQCIKYASLVEQEENALKVLEQEATLLKGLSYFDSYTYGEALKSFEKLKDESQGEIGAQSMYYIAFISYLLENHEESIKQVYALAKKHPSYKKWVTKGFILMSDNFVKQEDYFQAKYILKTVIESYEGLELKEEATEKLETIKELEAVGKEEPVVVEEEIKIGESSEESMELFENDIEEEDDNISIPELDIPSTDFGLGNDSLPAENK